MKKISRRCPLFGAALLLALASGVCVIGFRSVQAKSAGYSITENDPDTYCYLHDSAPKGDSRQQFGVLFLNSGRSVSFSGIPQDKDTEASYALMSNASNEGHGSSGRVVSDYCHGEAEATIALSPQPYDKERLQLLYCDACRQKILELPESIDVLFLSYPDCTIQDISVSRTCDLPGYHVHIYRSTDRINILANCMDRHSLEDVK